DSMVFAFFNTYPVLPLLVIVTNLVAFLPIASLLYIAQSAPLHNNCRYIISMWSASFGVVYLLNIGFSILDMKNDTGFMPLSMYEPRMHHTSPCIGLSALALIELSILTTAGIAMKACLFRYARPFGKTSLPVKEAYEMSKAMIPAYGMSFLLKLSIIAALTVFLSLKEEHGNTLGYLEAYY
ncbi:hypothetical protein PMAYCL1PPCAC_14967, partial [Pristionchus mayeri]